MKWWIGTLVGGILATSLWLLLRAPPYVGEQDHVQQAHEDSSEPLGASGRPVRRIVSGLPDWLTEEFRAKLKGLEEEAVGGLEKNSYHLRRAILFEEEVRRLTRNFESNDFLLTDVTRMQLHSAYERYAAGGSDVKYAKLRSDYYHVLIRTTEMWKGQGRMTAAESAEAIAEFERTFPVPR